MMPTLRRCCTRLAKPAAFLVLLLTLAILLLGLETAADQCLHGPDIARRCRVVSGLGIGAARRATKSWDVATLLALEIHLGLGRWGGSPCRRRRRLAWVLAGELQ